MWRWGAASRVMLVVVSVPEVFGTYQHYNYRVNVQRQAS